MRQFLLAATSLLLVATAARAQRPALPGAPQPGQSPVPAQPALPPAPQPAPAAPGMVVVYRLGETYQVQLRDGTTFTGKLAGSSLSTLEFSVAGRPALTVAQADIVSARIPQAPVDNVPGRQAGYYDIGNGSRYYFGPSGRNLRQGEAVAQDAYVVLAGINYGITNNFSMGGYLSLTPGASLDEQFFMLTPKLGFDVGNKWNLGAGALYIHTPGFDNDRSYNVGLLYGVATYGSADDNVSGGLGYGFADGSVGSTPTIYLAGQKRVSRLVSLVSENYIVAASNPVFFGIYGIKLNWRRVSLGVAAGYVGYSDNSNHNGPYGSSSYDDSYFHTSYVYPVYVDVSFRFGKPYQQR